MTGEAREIRELHQDGWRYRASAVEPYGDRYRPALVFTRDGRERLVHGPPSRLDEVAWRWCDRWVRRVLINEDD